jgi:signal transduction histidine kinase
LVDLARHTAAAMPLLPAVPGNYGTAVAHLLRGLALAGQARTSHGDERGGLLSELDDVTRWLAARAADAPDNFLHLLRLLEAERAWAAGDWLLPAPGSGGDALHELREMARGIHPAILAEGGLRPALKILARRSLIPVDLQVHTDERLPEPVEVSAYYVVAEALTNTAKHARASAVRVEVEVAAEVLRVAVRDDGAGGADLARGTGLVGLKDRVEALGGRIFLDSPRGAGTSLRVEFPLTATNGGVISR